MPRRRLSTNHLTRLFAALATFCVVWLVGARADAATPGVTDVVVPRGAPMCDPRGAAVFAPPPQIQRLEQSLDLRLEDACAGAVGERLLADQVVPGRTQLELSFGAADPTLAGVPPLPSDPACDGARLAAPRAGLMCAPSGVRSAVDRPPRG